MRLVGSWLPNSRKVGEVVRLGRNDDGPSHGTGGVSLEGTRHRNVQKTSMSEEVAKKGDQCSAPSDALMASDNLISVHVVAVDVIDKCL